MKRTKFGIKWKVFLCFGIFTVVIVCLLWLFQIVFLEDFYKLIKTNGIYSSAAVLEKNIERDDLQDVVSDLSRSQEVYVRIVTQSGEDISSAEVSFWINPFELSELYLRAVGSGGSYMQIFSNRRTSAAGDGGYLYSASRPMESIVYVRLARRHGREAMIILNAMISPVDATVQTLRVQLVWITVLLLLLSLVLSLVVSRAIAKPIERINRSARALAQGKYDISFPNSGYREIAELGDTLNYAASELAKTEGLRRELIANVSHDLRTPLTLITGYGEVMRDLPGENTPENVQIIIDEARRLTALVNDMLDISKLQSGTQQLNLTVFSLTQAVRETLKRYDRLTAHDGYQIDFVSDGEAMVRADELRISQVIYNLINNAINYTGDDKRITVTQTMYNGWARIAVSDTGEGIPEEMLPLIWDRYYKVDKTHKRAAVGTGLGLSIVKSTVELHGGRCGVFSRLGEGSTFWFELKTENDSQQKGSDIK